MSLMSQWRNLSRNLLLYDHSLMKSMKYVKSTSCFLFCMAIMEDNRVKRYESIKHKTYYYNI